MDVAASRRSQRGALMLEVMITIVIILIGLYGLMSVQGRLQISELESYQRAQALMLLNDMANRISTNRINAASYATTAASPLGAGMTCPAANTTLQQRDFIEWCNALQGAAETSGGSRLGAMVGGRGCVESIDSGDYFMVTVAWQGMTPMAAPPASVACGEDQYDGASGTPCQNDLCRRVVTTLVRVAPL
jgi:type IV pilus assembly protein PilV